MRPPRESGTLAETKGEMGLLGPAHASPGDGAPSSGAQVCVGRMRADGGQRFRCGDWREERQFKAKLRRSQQGRTGLCPLAVGNH